MDDAQYLYRTPRAAAARWARLYGELPGSVRGINYESMAMACCNTSGHETYQDIAIERLEEFSELLGIFQRAFELCRREWWASWAYVRIIGETIVDVAERFDVSKQTIRRWLSKVDSTVLTELVERDAVEGYCGRDMLEAGRTRSRGVTYWDGSGLIPLRVLQGGMPDEDE